MWENTHQIMRPRTLAGTVCKSVTTARVVHRVWDFCHAFNYVVGSAFLQELARLQWVSESWNIVVKRHPQSKSVISSSSASSSAATSRMLNQVRDVQGSLTLRKLSLN